MEGCPNFRSKEWKDNVNAVGEFQAMKDWLQYEDVRTVSEVMSKLNPQREAEIFSKTDSEDNRLMTREFAQDMMDFLEKKVGIKGQIINDPNQRWKGKLERVREDGKVRYIPTINLAYAEVSDGFHEYAHVFLAALRKSNPALFNSLYNELTSSPEWKEIKSRAVTKVKSMYPELTGNIRIEDYKEEILATAIGYASELNIEGKQNKISNNLRRVLDRIFQWLNSFFTEIFSYKLATNKINENTSLAQVIDWMTDTRTKFILDENWNDVYEAEIDFENAGGINVQESVSREQDIETNLTTDLEQAIIKDPKLDMETYISNWLDKTFKLPKKAYAPRKIPKSVIVENTAKSLLKKIGKTFEMYGLELKKDPSQNSEIVNKLINVLTPIEFTYKFANYLDKKANTSISLSQPFAVVKTTMIKDKTGVERKQTTINLPITENEAVVVNEFQKYLKDKNPSKKSMLADEIKAEYLAWVDENYGISWAEAKGYDFQGFGRAMVDSKIKDRTYKRITFADDFYSTTGHSLSVTGTEVVGPGIGWYVNSTINGERYDHEFQSDILPEIRKSYESGGYDSFKEEYIELSDAQKKEKINDLARNKIYEFIRKSNDRLFASSSYLMDLIREKKVYESLVDDDLPFSKIENYNINELKAAQSLLLSELDVRIDALISYRMGYLQNLANMKAELKMFQVLTGRKSELKEEVLKLFSTFRIEDEDMPGRPTSTRQTMDPDELPFSKLEGEKYLGISVKGGKRYKIYATAETYKNLPSFFQEFANQSNEWYNSNSRFKPSKEINAVDIINGINIPSYFSGDKLKSYPTLVKLRNAKKASVDKMFNNYRGTKRTIKAYEFRKIVYQDTANILKIAEYFKGQYERYVAFYEDIFQESMEYAKKKEKLTFDEHPEFKRYRRYYALFDKFFPILIAQSVNSAKMEGRDHYYLPTGKAMELIEGNPVAKNLYLTASETGEVISTVELGQRYIAQNTQESADVIKRYVGDKLYIYTQETTPLDIAVDLAGTGFYESKEFNNFAREERAKITLKKGMMPGPFNVALTTFAKKNNIKLTEETPEWSKAPLIKVDISGYTVKPIERFSKLEPTTQDINYNVPKFGDDFGKFNGSFRANVEGVKVLLGSGIISMVKMPQRFQNKPGYTKVSIPKVMTSIKGEVGGAEREVMVKDAVGVEMVDKFLTEYNIDFINVDESDNAYWVEIPEDVYEKAKSEKRISYIPTKKDIQSIQEYLNRNPQTENKGGDQLALFYKEINNMPSFTDIMNEQYPLQPLETNATDTDNSIATDTLIQYADAISQKLNVAYEIIDEERATSILENSLTPYEGDPAFVYGNKVYFIKNRVKLNMVFHEFAHPLVKAIRLQNPTLFNNLYTKLTSTTEGSQLVQAVRAGYPKLETLTDELKEEIVTRGIEAAAMDIKPTTGFAKFIKDVMYAIKQLLRKVFGQKITVQNLKPESTFKELAEMLMPGNQITMDLSNLVTEQDIAQYYKDTTEYLDALENIASKDYKSMQELIDINTKNILSHIRRLENSKNIDEIAEIFKDEFGASTLAKMKSQIGVYSTLLNQKVAGLKKDVAYTRNASSSLLTTLFNLETITNKIEDHLEKMDKTDRSTIYKASYYKGFLQDWSQFLEEGENFLTRNKADVPRNHPLVSLLGRIRNSIRNSNDIISEIDFKGFSEMLRLELQGSMEAIDKRYQDIFDHLKKIGAPEAQFKKWEAEYKKVRLTPEKIEETLKGKLGDANPLNAFLEGYLYSNDPVIGGFALYVKNNMTDVMVNALAKHNDFIKTIMPLLKDWGKYRPSRAGELGELTGFLDTIGFKNADGEFETKEVWTLLNQFVGYREVVSKFNYEIEELSREAVRTNDDDIKRKLLAKKREYSKFLIQYMHQKYVPAYYQRLELLWKDEVGDNLSAKIDEIFQEMNTLNEPTTSQADLLGTTDKIAKLWRDYFRLSSDVDIKGNKKEGMDLLMAERMREYMAKSKDLYDFVPKDRAFADAYEAYEQELIDKYARGFKGAQNFLASNEFIQYMDEFLTKNLRTTIEDTFWEDRQAILDRLKQLTSQVPKNEQLQEKLTEALDMMKELTKGYKDSDNQIIGSEMSNEIQQKIKDLDIRISNIKDDMKNDRRLKKLKYNAATRSAIKREIRKLEDLQVVEVTDYYLDAVNDLIADIEPTPLMNSKLGGSTVTRENIDAFLRTTDIIEYVKEKSPEFKTWFDRNHILGTYDDEIDAVDPDSGEFFTSYQKKAEYKRTNAWNIIRPRDEKYYKKFTFKKSDGTAVTVPGEPSLRFYNRVVKPELHTGYDFATGKIKLVVGVHVDNKSTEPNLPRTDVADRRFINQKYLDMKAADPSSEQGKLFKILEAIKEYHLENQKGLDWSKKLFYDFPRYHKNPLEILQTKDLFNKKWSAYGLAFRRIADFFRKAKDDPDSGLNPEDDWNLVKADMYDDASAKIPMGGLVGLDAEQVSTDILQSITKYMLSAEKNRKLIEMNPYAQAIKSILGNDKYKVKDLKSVNKFNFLYRGIITFLNKKGQSVRERAVNNFIEREFEGVTNTGLLSGNAFANKLSTMMFKRASFGFFALNIPSALKNQIGAKFQGLIEAAAGKHYNLKHFMAAEGWSLQLMKDISFNVYERGQKPVNIQVFDLFDPSEGRTEEKLGEGMSRTFLSDMANMSWLMNFRRWTELQATAQQFGSMMLGQKVDYNGKKVSYLDVWEIKDGKLQTKDGVDAAWSVTYDDQGNVVIGSEFKNFRNTVQAVIRDLNGAYSSFTQPEAQRYLVFRYFSYLRRYFTTMLMNRFGYSGSILRPLPRLNVGFGDVKEGYYISTAKMAMRTLLNIGRMMPYATPDEKRALLKVSTEVGALITMNLLLAPLFGWDPDDEDRFEKLRQKSGALPFFGLTEDDPYYPFHMGGWLSNQGLNLMMQVRAENEQFLPLPGFGLDDYGAFLDIKSIAAGPTLKKYGQIFEDVFYAASEDNRGFYQRDIGPYEWQQEESAKLWNHTFSTFGLTGSFVDPAVAVKNFQGIQARAR